MRTMILTAVALLAFSTQSMAQNSGIMVLLNACQRGNMSACQAIQPIIGNACRQGQQQACGLQKSILASRQNSASAAAVNERAMYQRCFSGDAQACKRLREGPKRDTSDKVLDLPGMSR
jgi:hypothetical protein